MPTATEMTGSDKQNPLDKAGNKLYGRGGINPALYA